MTLRERHPATWRAVRATCIYFLVTAGYILTSDYLLHTETADPQNLMLREMGNGLGLALVTSLLLFLTIRWFLKQGQQEAERQAGIERALRRSRDQLAEAQKIARLGSWELQLPSERLTFSEEAYEIFGIDPQQFGHTVDAYVEMVHPEDRALVLDFRAQRQGGVSHLEYEHRLVRPDGSIRHVLVLGENQVDLRGRQVSRFGTVQDITERKLVALELEQRNRQQAAIARLGIAALTQTSARELMNLAMTEAAEILGVEYTGVVQLLAPDGPLRLVAGRGWTPERIGQGEIPMGAESQAGYTLMVKQSVIVEDFARETRFRPHRQMSDQGVVSGMTTIIHTELGPWGVLGAHTTRQRVFSAADRDFMQTLANLIGEVLQRDRTARELIEGDVLRRIASEVASLGGWAVDQATRAVSWSDEVRRIHEVDDDYVPDEATALAFYAPEHRERIGELLRACGDEATPFDEELQLITATGRRVWVRTIGRPELADDGRVVRIIGAIQDISERRALEVMLHQSQRLEAVGKLTGGVAHDFNNLLTVILGSADQLVKGTGHNVRLHSMALTTLQAARRGADLTNRLLAYARKQPLAPRSTDIDELLASMEALLQRSLGERIEIFRVPAPDLPPAMVDPAQLEAAVLNLCLNARDAMPGGGRLTIETAATVLDGDYAAANDIAAGDYVTIAISDNGIGLTPELIDRVFEPFFTTKAAGQGSGLGLSMVYGFAKQSRGHVKLSSEPGQGTTVRLYLPASEAPAAIADGVAPVEPGRGANERILVVEDDDLVRRFVAEQLTSLGYDVCSARDGSEALRMIERDRQIDLLFTDVVMPGELDGPRLAAAAQRLRPELPVLFTSGYSENAIIHQGRLDEGVKLLTKPYRLAELAEALRVMLASDPR